MTRFGLDSTSMVPVAAHHAVGSTVAIRYLGHDTSKVVTRAEHQAYKAAGIDLCLVFEDGGRPDLSGYAGGKGDAEFAVNQAIDRLGTPSRPPRITFAWDWDPTGNVAAADAYYDGVAAVLGRERSGPYGGYAAVARLADHGFKMLWQTYAWSGGQFDTRAQLYQYANDHTVGGVGVDYDHVYGHDFGQWDLKPAPPLDRQHYDRFDKTVRKLGGGRISELETVREYDRLRKHPLVHRARLRVLRSELALLTGRVYTVAHQAKPPSWGAFHRGWRFQQLIHRSQGKRLAA